MGEWSTGVQILILFIMLLVVPLIVKIYWYATVSDGLDDSLSAIHLEELRASKAFSFVTVAKK
jgi:hypothetical protein